MSKSILSYIKVLPEFWKKYLQVLQFESLAPLHFRIHYKSIGLANIIASINTNIKKHIYANRHNTQEEEKLNKFPSRLTLRKKNNFGVFCFTRKLVKTWFYFMTMILFHDESALCKQDTNLIWY